MKKEKKASNYSPLLWSNHVFCFTFLVILCWDTFTLCYPHLGLKNVRMSYFCVNLDSFHHVLFLYASKTFLTQYPIHNPNILAPVLWSLIVTFKVFVFWSVLSVLNFWWLLSAFFTATMLKVCHCSCYKPLCCHFIDFESMVSKCEGGFSSCTQQSDNTEACSASND